MLKMLALLCTLFLIPSGAVRAGVTPTTELQTNTTPAGTLSRPLGTTAAAAGGAGADVVLLIDSSGSMQKTDPKNYRKNAAKLFISLLGREDRIGVMSFGDAATLLSPLQENSARNRASLFSAVDKITSKEFSTNITDAVQKAFDELKGSQNRNRILVMMSDGRLALGSREKDEAAEAALWNLLPGLANEHIKLYTVAFTGESDRAMLEKLALETGGAFRFAKEDKDVHLMFASVFEKIKVPDTVPFEGESFTIDSQIKEATVLVTKKAGTALTLVDPSDKRNTSEKHGANITWFESGVFDMITIAAPAAGKWSVKLSTNEGNKVYIVTNLSLKASLDKAAVTRNDHNAVGAWLETQRGIITEKGILDNTTFSASITGPDGTTGTVDLVSSASSTAVTEAAGKYAAGFGVPAAGEYSLTVRARGRTFVREKTLSFRANEPPAAPVAEQKQEPAPPPPAPAPAPPVSEEVSWTAVLVKLVIINLGLIAVAAVVLIIGKKKTLLKGGKK